MSRPPIIISNGGVRDTLATTGWGRKRLMGKIENLNKKSVEEEADRSMASWIMSEDDKAPLILWHLKFGQNGDEKRTIEQKLQQQYGPTTSIGDEISMSHQTPDISKKK